MSLPESGKFAPLLQEDFDQGQPAISPDGRWLAYVSTESGTTEVYVRPFPGPGGRWQISTGGGVEPIWRADGKAMLYRDDGILYSVPVDGSAAAFVAGRPERYLDGMPMGGNPHTYGLAPDGRVLALTYRDSGANSGSPTLVLNWASEVERLTLPVK
jgi:serine/threonine-protein kinase